MSDDIINTIKSKFNPKHTLEEAHRIITTSFKNLNKAKTIIENTTESRKKILYQHMIMCLGFLEAMDKHFDKYCIKEEDSQITRNNINGEDVIKYISENNVDSIKKFPDEWDRK